MDFVRVASLAQSEGDRNWDCEVRVGYYTGVEIQCDFETGCWIEDSLSGQAMAAALHVNVCVSQHARDLTKSLIGMVMLGSW